MLLVGELDDGVGPVIQDAFQPLELALGIRSDPVGDLDVLPPDDRLHASPPGRRPLGI
jgi:hypothetical protein